APARRAGKDRQVVRNERRYRGPKAGRGCAARERGKVPPARRKHPGGLLDDHSPPGGGALRESRLRERLGTISGKRTSTTAVIHGRDTQRGSRARGRHPSGAAATGIRGGISHRETGRVCTVDP